MTSPLARTRPMEEDILVTEAEAKRLQKNKETLIIGMRRYPIVSKTLMRSTVQVGDYLESTINRYLKEPDEAAGGKPYLSIVPPYRGLTHSFRFYLTRYESVLQPLFQPRLVEMLSGEGALERQRILEALDRFPILNPTTMQSALGPQSAQYFRPHLEALVKKGTVTAWHEDLLDPEKRDSTKRMIREKITMRGVRYFLTEHVELLQPFLISSAEEKNLR